MPKLSTRSYQVTEHAEARKPFTTHGALSGRTFTEHPPSSWDSGRLSGADLDQFNADREQITYAVFSYATPIGWATPAGWYRVTQRFSMTTSHHQGKVPRTDRTDLLASV